MSLVDLSKKWRDWNSTAMTPITCADELDAERVKLRALRDKWLVTAKNRLESREPFVLGTSTAYDVAAEELTALIGDAPAAQKGKP